MKHFSLAKMIAALLICNIYIFSCAVTGSVGSTPENTEEITDTVTDDRLTPGGTLDFIDESGVISTDHNFTQDNAGTDWVVIENLGFAKPTFVNKTIHSSYQPTSSVKELTQKSEAVSSSTVSSSYDEPDIYDENWSDNFPQSSSTTTSSEPVESSSSTTEEEPPESDPEPDNGGTELDTDASGAEIFRVNNNGTIVSGKAVDIVTQIVENEVGSTFAPEAIKAQAVTTYTYVKYQNLHGNAPYCVLKDSKNSSVRTLVESVIGEAIYYKGELIQAVYSASSAGSTASSQNVWGGYIPYLQSVKCDLDEKYDPNYGIKTTFSKSDMEDRLLSCAISPAGIDPENWFNIVNRTEGKYVGDMTICGQSKFMDKDGDMLSITGRRFREIIMDFDIRSSAFDIEYDADTETFTVITYGYGHGVGLSQNGANNLAKILEWDYKKILTFYFTGTEVY